jgi:hypothetical protein
VPGRRQGPRGPQARQGPGPVGSGPGGISRSPAAGPKSAVDKTPGPAEKAGKLENSPPGMSPLKLRPRYLAKAHPPIRPQAPHAGLSNDVHTLCSPFESLQMPSSARSLCSPHAGAAEAPATRDRHTPDP